MYKRVFAIGDIHGHSATLEALIRQISPGRQDLVVLVGDYLDRGPSSRAVIELICKMQEDINMVCLMGNHEAGLCAFLRQLGDDLLAGLETRILARSWEWWHRQGGPTLGEYMKPDDRESLVIPGYLRRFLQSLRPYFFLENENILFTHGAQSKDALTADSVEGALAISMEEAGYLDLPPLLWETETLHIPPPGDVLQVSGHTPLRNLRKIYSDRVEGLDWGDEWKEEAADSRMYLAEITKLSESNVPEVARRRLLIDTGMGKKDGWLTAAEVKEGALVKVFRQDRLEV